MIEDRKQPEVFLLRDRIVLVVVALGAVDGDRHPDLERRVDPIDDGDVAELLVVGPAFRVRQRVAVERRRQKLVDGRIGEHVAGDLFDRELVVRQIAVEGVDHPVAILPDGPRLILGIAVRVGVASQIEPHRRPAFAVGTGREHLVPEPLVRVRRLVGDEGVDVGDGLAAARSSRGRLGGPVHSDPPPGRASSPPSRDRLGRSGRSGSSRRLRERSGSSARRTTSVAGIRPLLRSTVSASPSLPRSVPSASSAAAFARNRRRRSARSERSSPDAPARWPGRRS